MDSKEPKNHSHSIYTSFILGIDEMQGLENNRILFDLKSNKPILLGICYFVKSIFWIVDICLLTLRELSDKIILWLENQ